MGVAPLSDERTPQEIAEDALVEDVVSYQHDPLGYVLYAFPWGEGELADKTGPEPWQVKILGDIGEKLQSGELLPPGVIEYAIKEAVASGHGVGKSALVSWLIWWGLSTFEDTKIVVTANTATQLATKTWAELAKWSRLAINSHWFEYTATALVSTDPAHRQTWRCDAIPWSKERSEAFAGLHNQGRRIIVIFDEASAIDDVIFEVTEGALTDQGTEILWFCFGNPTRNSGRFFECFHRRRASWTTWQVDSRTVSFTNKKQIADWISEYGEDSDFVKVRVKGEFPNQSDMQFIPTDIVEAARGRHLRLEQYNFAPVILALDPSWGGGDEWVIYKRQGLAASMLAHGMKNDDDFALAQRLAALEDEHRADGVLIDLGWGTGVYSAGKQMGRQWMLVGFGEASTDPGYLNKRTEMWAMGKAWLKEGGAIPNDPQLVEELTGPEYYTVASGKSTGKINLESKEDMKKRGLPSPNRADALMLTFGRPVAKKQTSILHRQQGGYFAQHQYDPLGG